MIPWLLLAVMSIMCFWKDALLKGAEPHGKGVCLDQISCHWNTEQKQELSGRETVFQASGRGSVCFFPWLCVQLSFFFCFVLPFRPFCLQPWLWGESTGPSVGVCCPSVCFAFLLLKQGDALWEAKQSNLILWLFYQAINWAFLGTNYSVKLFGFIFSVDWKQMHGSPQAIQWHSSDLFW